MQSELVQTFEQKQINSLPNEMLRTLLANLEVQKLIAIRAVCKRWLVVIEDICRENRSIVILPNNGLGSVSFVSERFNGLVDFSTNCALFDVKPKKYSQTVSLSTDSFFIPSSGKSGARCICRPHQWQCKKSSLFTQALVIINCDSTLTIILLPYRTSSCCLVADKLSDTIDNLTALKRFDFPTIDLIKQTTFVRLHHCFFSMVNVAKVLPRLGTNCTSLHLNVWVPLSDITPVLQLNAALVKGLTHLRIVSTKQGSFVIYLLEFCCTQDVGHTFCGQTDFGR